MSRLRLASPGRNLVSGVIVLIAAAASSLAMSAPTSSSAAKAAYSLRGIFAPAGYNGSLPSALNDQGNVVGSVETKSGVQEAFMWSAATGKLTLLGFPKGNIWTAATGINDAGLISAFGYTANYATTVPVLIQEMPASWASRGSNVRRHWQGDGPFPAIQFGRPRPPQATTRWKILQTKSLAFRDTNVRTAGDDHQEMRHNNPR